MKELNLHTDLDIIKELSTIIGQQINTIKELRQEINSLNKALLETSIFNNQQIYLINTFLDMIKKYPKDIADKLDYDYHIALEEADKERQRLESGLPF